MTASGVTPDAPDTPSTRVAKGLQGASGTAGAYGLHVEQWRPTHAQIDLDALGRNVKRIAAATGVDVCAVVKADGYGHGAVAVARQALDAGATWLAVALVEEAAVLRRAGIDAPILLLSEPPVAAVQAVVDLNLTATVYSEPFIGALDRIGAERHQRIAVHVKADTGMTRVGIPEDQWDNRLADLAAQQSLDITGVQTHLACADEPTDEPTRSQLAAFERFRALASGHGIDPPIVHAANTAAALTRPEARYTMVRAGIGIYGLSPSSDVDARDHGMEPVMRLVSQVAYAKRIPVGTAVSYGHRWQAPSDGWLATVPIGYADGVPRAISGQATVWLNGSARPIAGTVCMDQLMIWCGDHVPQVGDEVVLFGGAQGPRAEDWAQMAGSITYEIATGITSRVPRVVADSVRS